MRTELTLVDIGARGDLLPPWSQAHSKVNVIGFEADPIELTRLQEIFPDRTYLPYALGNPRQDLSESPLYLTRNRAQSSLFRPSPSNQVFESPHWRTRQVEATEQVKLRRLDDCIPDRWVDAIKIDTQGAEYDILQGSVNTLERCRPYLFLETWVHPVYEGAPLFHEILTFAYGLGYELIATSTAAAWRMDVSDITRIDMTHARQRLIGLNALLAPSLEAIAEVCDADRLASRIEVMLLFGFDDLALRLAALGGDIELLDTVTWRVQRRSRSRWRRAGRRIASQTLAVIRRPGVTSAPIT